MRVCTRILLQVFVDSYVWDRAHERYEECKIRVVVRCGALAAKRSGGTLAGAAWFAELSAQPLCARELPGLQVRRTASELCSVRPTEGAAGCGLRSGRTCARSASRSGQWERLAGTAAAVCAALDRVVAARAGESAEELEVRRGEGGGSAT